MLHVRKRQLLTNSICFNRAIGVQFNVADLRNNDRFVICMWNSPNVSCVFFWVSVTSSSESIGFCEWEGPLHPLTVIIKVVCSTFVTYVKCRQCQLVKDAFPKSFFCQLTSCKIQSLQKQWRYRVILVFFESGDPTMLHIDGAFTYDWLVQLGNQTNSNGRINLGYVM